MTRHRVFLSATSYPASLSDWKGLFIRHMLESLAQRGDLELELWAPPGETPEGVRRATDSAEARWLQELMDRGGIAHLLRRQPMRGLAAGTRILRMLSRAMERSQADVLHVNWLQNALALPADGRPALVTVLGTDMQLLRLPGMRLLLARAFRHRRVVLCPNADWMVEKLRRYFPGTPVQAVPFGIDAAWFSVVNQPRGPTEDWIAVTRITRGKIGHLFEWGAPHFSDGRRRLHLLGPMQESMPVPDWVVVHGATHPAALSSDWFPRAHGLISLSTHAEGRPQVMLEAMAAGLPIVATQLPAHTDLLAHGRTGMLVGSQADLGKALDSLSEPAFRAAVTAAARDQVRQQVGTWADCASRYHAIYCGLLDGGH
jgi:hypothetical protein